MVCSKCGYVMDAFDEECPRCHGKGIIQPEPFQANSSPTPQAVPSSHTRFCSHCGAKMAIQSQTCDACHKSNTSPVIVSQNSSNKPLYAASAVIVCVFGLFLLRGVFSGSNEKPESSRDLSPTATTITPPTSAPKAATSGTSAIAPSPSPSLPPPEPVMQTPNSHADTSKPISAPQPHTITITSKSLINKAESEINAATSEDQCNAIKGTLAMFSIAVRRRRQRLSDIGANGRESLELRYLSIVLDNLFVAAEHKRKAVIQVNPEAGRMYQSDIHIYISSARVTSRLCPGDYTFTLSP